MAVARTQPDPLSQGEEEIHRITLPSVDVARSEVALFFVLTFAWTWVFWGMAVFSHLTWPEPALLLLFALGGIGPAFVASVLVAASGGHERLSAFGLRVVDPRRIPPLWFLVIPTVAAGPALLSKLVPGDTGDAVGLPVGSAAVGTFAVAILAGLAEEPGWRGYALDRLQTGSSALWASLVLGVVWSLWHLPLFFIAGTYHHALCFGSWRAWLFFAVIVPGSVLYTWIYNNTSRSILAVVFYHAIGNAAGEVLSPTEAQMVVRILIEVGLVVAVIVVWGSRTLTRRHGRP